MLQLREYQSKILDNLRKGFASGKRAQILYAPTGAGKTEMAIELLKATKTKGNKAATSSRCLNKMPAVSCTTSGSSCKVSSDTKALAHSTLSAMPGPR